ncbi:MAG: sigma-70 family RNA polymerase sigma factor [Myxococcota bacterium]
MRILRGREEAEDVLHDVFLEVWTKAHTYDAKRASVRSWLLLRMRSRCLDRIKSAAVSRRRPLDAAPETADPSDMVGKVDAARVEGWLSGLSEDQRRVILLGYFDGMSCSEMATHLSIPIGTVKSRLAAAMRKLRAELGSEASP